MPTFFNFLSRFARDKDITQLFPTILHAKTESVGLFSDVGNTFKYETGYRYSKRSDTYTFISLMKPISNSHEVYDSIKDLKSTIYRDTRINARNSGLIVTNYDVPNSVSLMFGRKVVQIRAPFFYYQANAYRSPDEDEQDLFSILFMNEFINCQMLMASLFDAAECLTGGRAKKLADDFAAKYGEYILDLKHLIDQFYDGETTMQNWKGFDKWQKSFSILWHRSRGMS